MAEYPIVGGIVMGHALPKTTITGRLHPMPRKEPNRSWHHDWRGMAYLSAIYALMVVSGGAISWSLWHLSLNLLK